MCSEHYSLNLNDMKTSNLYIIRNILIAVSCILICSPTISQPASPGLQHSSQQEKYTPEEIKTDLDFLVDILQYHPQLNLYTPRTVFEQLWSAAYEIVNREQSLKNFYGIIAPIVEKVRCSHTGLRLPHNPPGIDNTTPNYFPIEVFVDENRMYCLEKVAGKNFRIPAGSEIISINHVPVSNIMKRLLSFIPYCINTQLLSSRLFP